VVDYLSFKFYGILGLERFPAFNVADTSIVVSGILLVILFILQERRNRE
jgi:signal peptidase II